MTKKEAQLIVDSLENRLLPRERRQICPACDAMQEDFGCQGCPGHRKTRGYKSNICSEGLDIQAEGGDEALIQFVEKILDRAGYYIDEVDA